MAHSKFDDKICCHNQDVASGKYIISKSWKNRLTLGPAVSEILFQKFLNVH